MEPGEEKGGKNKGGGRKIWEEERRGLGGFFVSSVCTDPKVVYLLFQGKPFWGVFSSPPLTGHVVST